QGKCPDTLIRVRQIWNGGDGRRGVHAPIKRNQATHLVPVAAGNGLKRPPDPADLSGVLNHLLLPSRKRIRDLGSEGRCSSQLDGLELDTRRLSITPAARLRPREFSFIDRNIALSKWKHSVASRSWTP